jgi:hypothetical protein
LSEARRRSGHVVELAESARPGTAELMAEHPPHVALRHGRPGRLQLAQRLVIGLGDLLGHQRVEDAQRLADLHRAAFELAEDGEELLSVARGRRRRHLRPVRARQPAAQACNRPSAEGERQGHQFHRPGELVDLHVYYYE